MLDYTQRELQFPMRASWELNHAESFNSFLQYLIDNNGNVLEGGGGSIMAKDINGVYFEVLSDREFFGDITVRKILKANNR